jgi:hypothetical protein
MKISLAFVQRNLISYSASWTCLPGRLPRTGLVVRMRKIPSNSLSITESRSGSVCSAIQMMCGGGCDGCDGCCEWRWCTKRRVRGFSKTKKKEENQTGMDSDLHGIGIRMT